MFSHFSQKMENGRPSQNTSRHCPKADLQQKTHPSGYHFGAQNAPISKKNQIFSLNYEQLINNQKEVTANLLEFCNLDWEDACLEFHKTDRTNKTASSVQVRQPLYTSSVKLWKNYKEQLSPLINALKL